MEELRKLQEERNILWAALLKTKSALEIVHSKHSTVIEEVNDIVYEADKILGL
jgi:hypothetical protein